MTNWRQLWVFLCFLMPLKVFGQSPEQLASGAMRLQQEGKYEEALKEWDKAILKNAKSYSFWIAKSQCCLVSKDTAKAIAVLQKGIQSNPQTSEIQWALAGIWEKQQKWVAALRLYQAAFTNEKDEGKKVLAASRCAELMVQTLQYTEALRITQEALKIDSTHRECLYWQGRVFNETAQYEKTLVVLRKATQKMVVGTNAAKYFYELGYALFQLEKFKEASFELRKADVGAFKPRVLEMTAPYYFQLADGYYKAHEYEKSQEAIVWVLKIDPTHRPAALLKKEIEKLGFVDIVPEKESIVEGLKIFTNTERRAALYANLCRLEFAVKNYEEATKSGLEYLKIKNQGGEANVSYYVALSMYKTGKQYKEASAILTNIVATQTDPESEMTLRSHFALGLIALKMLDLDLAKSYFKKASRSFLKFASKAEIKKIEQMRQMASLNKGTE